jgi:type VI secretion system protein VasG
MGLSRDPLFRNDADALAQKMKPELLKVFPAALLGRIVSIPYYPLSDEMLAGIIRLQLGRIGERIKESHSAAFVYNDQVIEHIISMCNEPETGGRMVDNIITNTLLPALSREFLKRSLAKEQPKEARVTVENGEFSYQWT